jgi:dephospho-CoA kinase
MIIGLSGKIDSGKTTVAEYFETKYGFQILSTSKMLKSILDSQNLEINRENLQKIGKELIDVVGGSGFIAIMLEYLPPGNYVIEAIRHKDAFNFLRKKFGNDYYHIHIDTDENIRYSRRKDRYNPINHYRKVERADTELEINELKNLANFIVINDGNFEDMNSQIEGIYNRILNEK